MEKALRNRLKDILEDKINLNGFDSIDDELLIELGFEIVEKTNMFDKTKKVLVLKDLQL